MRDANTIPRSERIAATFVGLMLFGSLFPLFAVGGIASVVLPLAVVIVGWRMVPGFWRTIGGGALAGAIAGVLVLGPGMRVAMRIVAITEPTQSPEFTVGGTLFIVVFLGVIFGAPTGAAVIFIARGLEFGRLGAALLSAGALLALLMAPPDIRSELFELGLGAGLNILMFGLVGLTYGLATHAVFGRLKFAATREAPSVAVMA